MPVFHALFLQTVEGGDGIEGGGAAGGEKAGSETGDDGEDNRQANPAPGHHEVAFERDSHEIAEQQAERLSSRTAGLTDNHGLQ